MLARMSPIRSALRWALSIGATLIIVPVFSQWFVELAKEKGFYEVPSSRVEMAMNWLASITALPGYQLAVGLVVGLVCGAWLDVLARRIDWRRAGKASAAELEVKPAPAIDVEALAQEAETLAVQVRVLLAQYEGRLTAAFHDRARSIHNESYDASQDYARVMTAGADVEGLMKEQYARNYYVKVEDVINKFKKIFSFNGNEYCRF